MQIRMASRKEHCKRTLAQLGNEWECVHTWIDGLACVDGQLNIHHRRERHNIEGVEYCREEWGDEAAEAAIIHIAQDGMKLLPRAITLQMWPEEPELISFESLNGGNKRTKRNQDPRKYD